METFSPLVKQNSIKLLVALARQYNLEIHQLDVETRFLHRNLEEEIYIDPLEG